MELVDTDAGFNFLEIVDVIESNGLMLNIVVKKTLCTSRYGHILSDDRDPAVSVLLTVKERNDLMRALGVSTVMGLKGHRLVDLVHHGNDVHESLDEYIRRLHKVWIRDLLATPVGGVAGKGNYYAVNVSLLSPEQEDATKNTWLTVFTAKVARSFGWYDSGTAILTFDQVNQLVKMANVGQPLNLTGRYFVLPEKEVFFNPVRAIFSILEY